MEIHIHSDGRVRKIRGWAAGLLGICVMLFQSYVDRYVPEDAPKQTYSAIKWLGAHPGLLYAIGGALVLVGAWHLGRRNVQGSKSKSAGAVKLPKTDAGRLLAVLHERSVDTGPIQPHLDGAHVFVEWGHLLLHETSVQLLANRILDDLDRVVLDRIMDEQAKGTRMPIVPSDWQAQHRKDLYELMQVLLLNNVVERIGPAHKLDTHQEVYRLTAPRGRELLNASRIIITQRGWSGRGAKRRA